MPAPRLFVAFAGPDRDAAEKLVTQLRGWGCDVTWEHDLPGDQPFTQRIPEAMRGCTRFVFLVTGASADAWYEHEEVRLAVDLLRHGGGEGIHVVTDLPLAERPYGLTTLPPVAWRGDSRRAAFGVAMDALGWRRAGARAEPPDVPCAPEDPRHVRYLSAARLAIALVDDDPDRIAKPDIVAFLRANSSVRFADVLASPDGPEDPLHVLRGALFRLADANDGSWRRPLEELASAVEPLLAAGGVVPARLEAWMRDAGVAAARVECPPALVFRLEELSGDGTFFVTKGEARRAGAVTRLWTLPQAAGQPLRRWTRAQLGAAVGRVVDQKLREHRITAGNLLLLLEVDAGRVDAGFHAWEGFVPGCLLGEDLLGVAAWPCVTDALGEPARAFAPDEPPAAIPAPGSAPGRSVRISRPVTARELNYGYGAGVAVFAERAAWRTGADGRGPAAAHSRRLLTLLIEHDAADDLLDELFSGRAEITVREFFDALRRVRAGGMDAHLVWTDPRHLPAWPVGGPDFFSL